MAAVKLGIIALNHDDGLAPIIKLLGVRQRQAGMKVRDYRTMAKAMIWTLERSLEKKFTRQDQGCLERASHPGHPHPERQRRRFIAERRRHRRRLS